MLVGMVADPLFIVLRTGGMDVHAEGHARHTIFVPCAVDEIILVHGEATCIAASIAHANLLRQ